MSAKSTLSIFDTAKRRLSRKKLATNLVLVVALSLLSFSLQLPVVVAFGLQLPSCTLPTKPSTNPRHRMSLQFSMGNSGSDLVPEKRASEEGSVLGASLLFAGTAIGAGMLALPAETAPAGYLPSEVSLLMCWAFTYITSIVTLEASWTVGAHAHANIKDGEEEEEELGAGFLSISRETLGPIGVGITALLFWFLLTSIVVAYTSEGGELIAQVIAEFSSSSVQIPTALGSTIFAFFFAVLDFFGTERVDLVNRVLVTGLITCFLGLVAIGSPEIDFGLLSQTDWGPVYPSVISVGILSFGAQNVVPTLLKYLGRDPRRTRRAVLIGSLIPLVMYSLWEAVFLGMVPYDVDAGGSKMQIVAALGDVGGTIVQDLVELFSVCAIGSSMAGASVSLVDFFQDAINSWWMGADNIAEQQESKDTMQLSWLKGRFAAATLALGPPLAIACAFPDAFLGALENAGLIGGVSLYGILPALAVIQLRKRSNAGSRAPLASITQKAEDMPGRLIGGTAALCGIIAISAMLVIPEFVRLGEIVFVPS